MDICGWWHWVSHIIIATKPRSISNLRSHGNDGREVWILGPHSSTTAVPLGREDLWSSMAYGHLWSVPAVREGRRVASVDLPRFTSTLA